MIWFPTQQGQVTWHELLIALFLFLTAPMTGFFIAKAHMHLGWDAERVCRARRRTATGRPLQAPNRTACSTAATPRITVSRKTEPGCATGAEAAYEKTRRR